MSVFGVPRPRMNEELDKATSTGHSVWVEYFLFSVQMFGLGP